MAQGPATRDVMEYDVAVIGAGPAGLATAIRLKQRNAELRVCILEKGSTVGAHILSGAVLEPAPARCAAAGMAPGLAPHLRAREAR